MNIRSTSITSMPPLEDWEILAGLPVCVDYILLVDRFSHYRSPRKKIFDLRQRGYLYSIARGRYFNGRSSELRTTPKEEVANAIYFPSYVSLEWALQFYGLLADRVHTVTSVTSLRSKEFRTPSDSYTFSHIACKCYPIGYVIHQADALHSFFVAQPEKALVDLISVQRPTGTLDIGSFLERELRIDVDALLLMLERERLLELSSYYHRASNEFRTLRWLARNLES